MKDGIAGTQTINNRKVRFCAVIVMVAGLCLGMGFSSRAQTQSHSPSKEETRMSHASGTFDVKLTPQDDKTGDTALGRFTIEKQFHGDLEGASKGQMLGANTSVKGSAGYVAMERISGTLHGRNGTFILQHTGTMTRGALQLSVTVVPDSGTDQLAGLTGKMDIKIEGGKHYYEFEYLLGDANSK